MQDRIRLGRIASACPRPTDDGPTGAARRHKIGTCEKPIPALAVPRHEREVERNEAREDGNPRDEASEDALAERALTRQRDLPRALFEEQTWTRPAALFT